MKNLIYVVTALCFITHVNAQIPKLFKKRKAPEKVEAPKPKKEDKNGIKPYDKVITEKGNTKFQNRLLGQWIPVVPRQTPNLYFPDSLGNAC